ncbi:uncharacterized protein LOC126842351 [Adelges cooleyi]|uniref:uncharacterized protein LOC126842351 n=1 Tax=Adelges cooleyi TaxID=133065 RepID=UPI0021806D0C|nr:uncharacterized protein LOC126842351 [Adelges cooleyi]
MGKLFHGLLISCILAVVYAEDALKMLRPIEHEEDAVAAEDHEHHRIIIVVPKEVPHHVNHVHTYKIAGKGIPLIHSGKVVHDHKHSGKVAHEHGHAGKSFHNHKHGGHYGHNHKHNGYLGHKHFGHVDHKGHAHQQEFADPHGFWQHLTAPKGQRQHGQIQQQGQLQQQRRPVADKVQYVPSSHPQGLGSFIPSEIVHGRHGIMQQFVASGDGRRAPQSVYHVQVADEDGPNVVKHLELDLANNVAKLQTPDQRQPVYQTVTQQYSQVIGVGRAVPSAEGQEFEGQTGEVNGGGADDGDGDLSLEDGSGYRFGEGYRLALESDNSHDYSAAQEQDEDEADEFKEPVNFGVENDGNVAFSQAYRVQF